MKIEVLTIGDEVLSGAITDTNFAWLGESLWTRGYTLHWHQTVGDEPEAISEALRLAASRSQAVIVTGGLGPTSDDITIETAAKTFGVPLVMDPAALSEIEERFRRMNREMSENNKRQALLPQGARRIPNPFGTAPGTDVDYRGCRFFFLPGVPREMKGMFEASILPALEEIAGGKRGYAHKILRCFGAPEATMAHKLEGDDPIDLSGVDLAYRVFFPEILLKVTAWDKPDQKVSASERVATVVAKIRERLGDLAYSEDDVALPRWIGETLRSRGETIATAESCTGGLVANLLTDVPGSSSTFERGVVTYSNESKMQLLNVPAETLQKHGAVSEETAIAMAEGIRRLANTTYGIGITGIAGPDGGTPEKPVGTVHIALATPRETVHRKLFFSFPRDMVKRAAAFSALDLLRKSLRTTGV